MNTAHEPPLAIGQIRSKIRGAPGQASLMRAWRVWTFNNPSLATLSETNICFSMKKIAYFTLLLVIGSGFAASQALAQKKAEKAEASPAAAAAESKMTKEQAEKAVMKRYPAAKITGCEQKTMNGKSGWIVRFTETGGNIAQQFMVDENGKLTRL